LHADGVDGVVGDGVGSGGMEHTVFDNDSVYE